MPFWVRWSIATEYPVYCQYCNLMLYITRAKKDSIAHPRAVKLTTTLSSLPGIGPDLSGTNSERLNTSSHNGTAEKAPTLCQWEGGISHYVSSDDGWDSGDADESESDGEVEELEGEELHASLHTCFDGLSSRNAQEKVQAFSFR